MGRQLVPFLIIMPSYDDWDSVRTIIPLLDAELYGAELIAHVLLVDDASRIPCPSDVVPIGLQAIRQCAVVRLWRNLGHQRALCVALCATEAKYSDAELRGVVVMDADGEDLPSDVPRLIRRFLEEGGQTSVFARRIRRSEGPMFRLFYWTYRSVHRVLTGIPVQIGNFSVMPLPLVRRLCTASELWNHYAAAAVHTRLPMSTVETTRGTRLRGESRMNFVALVSHGLSAMAVFAERIGTRALLATLALAFTFLVGAIFLILSGAAARQAGSPWLSIIGIISALLLMQSLLLALVFAFLVHFGRAGGGFLPARDYRWFIEGERVVWEADD